jgi:AP-2 complex subunit beta-1
MCISTLLELLETKIDYVVQEVIVVVKDIFRRYPSQYESVIPKLCEHLDNLTESEAKAAMIWIIGQYADRIDNSVELLDDLSYDFLEQPVEVGVPLPWI